MSQLTMSFTLMITFGGFILVVGLKRIDETSDSRISLGASEDSITSPVH